MSYERQYYTNGDVLEASHLDHMEAGIKENSDSVSKLSEDIADLKENGTGGGVTTAQANSLWTIMQKTAFSEVLTDAELNAFKTAWGIGGEVEPDIPEVTLTSISATYTGGEVTVGTSVTSLTGITVKAHYSDGTSKTVSGYTLSGTIAEGSNTITVSYDGKSTTFTVTGVAESGGEDTGVSNENMWTDGVAYTFEKVADEYVKTTDGTLVYENGWGRSPYLNCDGASKLRVVAHMADTTLLTTGNAGYNGFYDENKTFIKAFSYQFESGYAVGDYVEIDVPTNAVYFIITGGDFVITSNNSIGRKYIDVIPYA